MYIGAFDIGGTKTIIALADETGKIYEKKQFVTDTAKCSAHLSLCCDVFEDILKNQLVSVSDVAAIGVNLPGIVNRREGILLKAVYAGWNNIPVAALLRERLQVEKIACENDVNACAAGELRFGLGKDYDSFGWMTVSTGVGGAVVCDGKLIRGAHGNAGEFGHIKVEYENPELCPCGEEGCLEAHGSGTALGKMIRQEMKTDPVFAAAIEDSKAGSEGAALAKLAGNGDTKAHEIFQKVGQYLGRGIACYVNIMDPEAVIIGGGVSASLKYLMPGILKSMQKYAFAPMQQVKILPTALGYEAALMGAVAVAVQMTG